MNRKTLDWIEIEQALGRPLEEELQGAIKSLHDFPLELLEEARKLPAPLQLRFMEYYLDEGEHPYAAMFYESVVREGEDPENWLRGGILTASLPLEELLAQDVSAILGSLQPRPGEAWMRFRQRWNEWISGCSPCGAPALLRPDLDYHYWPPKHIKCLTVKPFVERLEPVHDIALATRRWLAAHFAEEAARLDLLGKVWDLGALITAVVPDAGALSNDASIALTAMLREQRDLGVIDFDSIPYNDRDLYIPGFRGPDGWYAGNVD